MCVCICVCVCVRVRACGHAYCAFVCVCVFVCMRARMQLTSAGTDFRVCVLLLKACACLFANVFVSNRKGLVCVWLRAVSVNGISLTDVLHLKQGEYNRKNKEKITDIARMLSQLLVMHERPVHTRYTYPHRH